MLEKVRKHFLTDLDHYRLYLASLPSDAYVECYRWKTWIVLEYPYSSMWAKVCVPSVISVSYSNYFTQFSKKYLLCCSKRTHFKVPA